MQRPDNLDTSDVEGARSRPLPYRPRTEHPFNTNVDIERSAPQQRSFVTQRTTEPLAPAYKLPSYQMYDAPPGRASATRELLWTLEQPKWRANKPPPEPLSDKEVRSNHWLYHKHSSTRNLLAARDITGPQFRIEEPMTRRTNPLMPTYEYDSGAVEPISVHVPKYGCRYPRKPNEDFGLMTKDIATVGDSIMTTSGEYPKHLIATRKANRTDDIVGAQANTIYPAPKIWREKNPSALYEKETNRVWDIQGAVSGTTGQLPLYASRKQDERMSAATAMSPATKFAQTFRATTAPHASSAARDADIAAVKALN